MVEAALICRPSQLREAAIVLAALPSGPLGPILVVEPPPISQHAYRELYLAYRELSDARDKAIGAAIGRAEVAAGKVPAPPANTAVDARARQLTPYRAWVKRMRALGAILEATGPQRVILLFEPHDEDITFVEPAPLGNFSSKQLALLPPATATQVLNCEDVAALPARAWALFRSTVFDPQTAVEIVPADSPAVYLSGLFCARLQDVPLQPAATPANVPTQTFADPNDDAANSEAVLIEAGDDAEMLLGVAYALQRRARLIVCAPPEIAPIEARRAAAQERRESGGAKSIEPAAALDDAALAALKRSLFRDSFEQTLEALEEAVSAAVSDATIAAVGDRRLTVLTRGVPYSFVKRDGADWSNKPIGHVTGDISLLLLPALFGGPDGAAVGFNLLVDPGFFTTSETTDVLTQLGDHSSFPLLTRGDGGTSLSLQSLARNLPLDLVFFNTHGSDGAILFRDGALEADKIVQRFDLVSRPIVFNNSCLSWIGVGRAFLRAGARGYVGTLWSVDAAQAAALAKVAIGQMVNAAQPVSEALLNTGAASGDARAYLFVGPVDTKLAPGPPPDDDARRAQLFATAERLLTALERWVKGTGAISTLDLVNAPTAQLWAAVGDLNRRLGAVVRPGIDLLPILDLTIHELLVHSLLADASPDHARAGRTLLDRCEQMFASVTDPVERAKRMADCYQYASRLPPALLAPRSAQMLLSAAVSAAQSAGVPPGGQLLELSDRLRVAGDYAGAQKAAQAAVDSYARAEDTQRRSAGSILALGRLTQIALRTDPKAAVGFAGDGFARALEAGDYSEQAAFKNDEARGLLALGDPRALASARAAVDAARMAHDDGCELSAYGVLVRALVQSANLDEARERALLGLATATQLGLRVSAGDFLVDLGAIAEAAQQPLEALTFWRQAAFAFAGQGRLENEGALLNRMERTSSALEAWEAHAECMRAQLAVVDDFGPKERGGVCTSFVRHLTRAVSLRPFDESRETLQQLVTALAADTRSSESPQRAFMHRAAEAFLRRAEGDVAEAVAQGALLDALSQGVYGFVALFAQDSKR